MISQEAWAPAASAGYSLVRTCYHLLLWTLLPVFNRLRSFPSVPDGDYWDVNNHTTTSTNLYLDVLSRRSDSEYLESFRAQLFRVGASVPVLCAAEVPAEGWTSAQLNRASGVYSGVSVDDPSQLGYVYFDSATFQVLCFHDIGVLSGPPSRHLELELASASEP